MGDEIKQPPVPNPEQMEEEKSTAYIAIITIQHIAILRTFLTVERVKFMRNLSTMIMLDPCYMD
ncbi:hypothetical protein A2U01_0025779 [Trifolium medium]|uniref:Uncharacterized protein n=1 Tax=Trifolium medium TaxID=97028 RepID=A0A392NZ35_9FABA|nr:hypothetical protein [Trifolium medium]